MAEVELTKEMRRTEELRNYTRPWSMLPTGGTPVAMLNAVDIECIRSEFEAIRDNVNWVEGGSGDHTSINYKESDKEEDRQTSLAYAKDRIIPLDIVNKGPAYHRQFKHYNSEYDNTLIKAILEHFDCFGSRILTIESATCLMWHDDRALNPDESYYRIHIPIHSNPGNFFAFESGLYRLEPGWVYLVDTTRKHSFFNASYGPRYHIVGSTNMTKRMKAALKGDGQTGEYGWSFLDKKWALK